VSYIRNRQRPCSVCATALVAMIGVDYCFACWPGGPVIPPPCLRCGARTGYYTSGICVRCHPSARPGVDSCLDCYAWGATRHLKWLCCGCSSWRATHARIDACRSCARTVTVNPMSVCRLCRKQATRLRQGRGTLDLLGANRHGQQLFLADMFRPHPMARPSPTQPATPTPLQPLPGHQLVLFELRRDLAAHGRAGLPQPADPTLAADLARRARDYAAQRGWSKRQTNNTCHGIRIVLGIQDTPGAMIKASDVALLRGIDLPVWTVLEVLADAGLLEEDRTPAIDAWFAEQTSGLPEAMAGELGIWFEVVKHGCATPPRRRPRNPTTIGLHLRWALPTLRAWAAAGHASLREISRAQVLDALPAAGNPRATTGQGLKSIFRVLKARKVLFADPTVRVKTGYAEARQPLPVDLDAVRAALHSASSAQAAVVALIAFHGLRSGQLRRLRLTDLRDGRLHVDGRVIVLAEPVRIRLAAWLDQRTRRWPQTPNPFLFVHYRSAARSEPVGLRWIRLTIGAGLTATAIREDRILNEAHATGGDARRLADLFGLSIQATTRYTATVDHPDLIDLDQSQAPQQDSDPGGPSPR
jgi:integrase